MLSHLSYVSVRKPNCTEEEIQKILKSCEKNNPPLEITGVLLYSDNKFIQYVEGEAHLLTSLYDKIKKDPRHEKTVMISFGPISEKLFPSWHMGNKAFQSNEIEYGTMITEYDKDLFKKILGGEREEGAKVQNLLARFFKK